MKQLLIVAAACLTFAASAQNKDVENLRKKLDKSDLAIADAKKGLAANTWIGRAQTKIDMGIVYTNKMIAGVKSDQLTSAVVLGAPQSTESVVIGGKNWLKYSYEHFDFYTGADSVVMFWDARDEALPDAFVSALADLTKAKELSAKEFAPRGKAVPVVDRLYNEMRTIASNSYSLAKLETAGRWFEMAAKAKELEGIVDTSSYFYAGITYFENGKFDRALPLFEKISTMGFDQDGTTYHYLATCLDKLDNKARAVEVAEKGFAKYPKNPVLMGGLINVYMSSNQNPEKLIDLIQKAQSLDTANISLYLVEAEIRNKLGQHDQAYGAIDKALELEPKNFDAVYNYGILKVLEAERVVQQANKLEINDTKNYETMIFKAVALQKEAIVKLEIAYELQKENLSVVEILRQLYFPRRDDSAEMQSRYDFFNNLSQKLKGE